MKNTFTLISSIIIFAFHCEAQKDMHLNDTFPKKFIGLSLTGNMSIDFDPTIDKNPLKVTTTVIPEYGYIFQNGIFTSGILGMTKTHWNLEYAKHRYNWTEIVTGVKIGKQFKGKLTQYVISFAPTYHYQWYDGYSNQLKIYNEYSWYSLNLSNGILLFKEKKLNVLPKIELSYEIKPASINIPRDITQLKTEALIEFRYNIT